MNRHIKPETHPLEYRTWAYELWAFIYARNARAVARRIAEPEEGDPYAARDIPDRTIRYWVEAENWPARIHDDLKKIAPDLHESVSANIALSAVKFSEFLQDLANDRVPMTTMVEVQAAKLKHDAARTAFDRSGHMPWIRPSDNSKPVGPTRDYAESIAQLDDDQLRDKMYSALTALADVAEVIH